MKRLRLFIFFLALLGAPIGARAASDGEIAGRVVDALTGNAIARAKVVLTVGPADRMALLTDDEGSFRVLHLPAGPISIWAQRPGYLGDPSDPPTPESRAQVLIAGSDGGVTPVTLKLTPQAVIEGRATDATGAGTALVRLWERTPDGKVAIHGEERVDRTGEFRFAPLASGRYYLEVSSLPGTDRSPVYLHRFFEEGQTLESARPIDLDPGQTRSLLVPLQSAQAHQIRGRLDCAASGAAAVWLTFPGNDSQFSQPYRDLATQTFSIPNVPPGAYLLKGSCDVGGKQVMTSLPVTVSDADINGVVLSFER